MRPRLRPRAAGNDLADAGDPGPANIFHIAVYDRGAMAIHQMRLAMGDDAFFETLRTWVESRKYGNGNIAQFQALAEQISGVDLDAVFTTWLYTAGRPTLPASASASAKAAPSAAARTAAEPKSWAKLRALHDELSASKS